MSPNSKLTILFLAANPENTNRVKLDEEAHAIDEVLRKAEFRVFDLRSHWALRYNDLPELLMRYNPHIVHFSGHGSTLGDIALQDESGKMHLVQPDALAALFSILKDNIRCVVLSACYSQIQAEGIASSIDFVVGMNREIADSAAINFAAGFYRGLGFGRTIRTAFDLGCIEIGLAGKGNVQTTARPPVTVGTATGGNVLGGNASIPQLLALRSDPAQVKLVDSAAVPPASASPAAAQGGGVAAGAGGVAVGGNVFGSVVINQGGQPASPPPAARPAGKLTKLTGKQFGALQEALLEAFDNDMLTQMVTIQLDETLANIAGNGTFTSVVFELITWAQRTGNLDRLLDGALAANPENPHLQAVNQALRG